MQESYSSVTPPTDPEPLEKLRYRTARAALTSGGAEVVNRALTIVLSIATARMLEPVEVGVLGLAIIIVGFISMVGYYPEIAAVTAPRSGRENQLALVASMVRAGIIGVLLLGFFFGYQVFATHLGGDQNSSATLNSLLVLLAWLPVIELVIGYPQIVLVRRLELSYIAMLQVAQPVLFVGLAIVLLLLHFGPVGVIWSNLLSTLLIAGAQWYRLFSRGYFTWNGLPAASVWKEAVKGTGKIFAGGFGGYLGERIDNLLVAACIGPASMSFYSMAWNASRAPSGVFARAISFVLVPTFAHIKDQPHRAQRALRECLRNSYLLLTPICALMIVCAPRLTEFVLGPKWLPLVPCLRIMSLSAMAGPLLFVMSALLTGTGRAHFSSIGTIVHILILIVLIPILTPNFGIVGAAYAEFCATAALAVALTVIVSIISRRVDPEPWLAPVLPIVASGGAAFLSWVSASRIDASGIRLAVEVGVLGAAYLLFLVFLGGKSRLAEFGEIVRGVLNNTPSTVEAQT